MDLRSQTNELLCSAFSPPSGEPSWQWCERNIVLSKRVTQSPGPYSTRLVPFVRGVFDAYDDPTIRTIVLCWGSRSSKTETLLNILRKNVAVEHESYIYCAPSIKLARDWSETRWIPSIEDSPILAREIPDNSDQFKLETQHFKHCTGFFIGAGSPANLSGRGVCLIIGDEIDRWDTSTSKETGALQNLLERNNRANLGSGVLRRGRCP